METKLHYPWKRFWVPRDGIIRYEEQGYLVDPEGPSGQLLNPEVVPFETIANTGCLALLGEPGIGKTTVLRSLTAHKKQTNGGASVPCYLDVDLRSYSSEDRLYRDIFESREFTAWVNSTYILEIFLDSLDECLVHIRTVASLLADQLKKYPTSRLQLRIACRTAEWPRLLNEELPKIWVSTNYGAYELAPLRRVDVAEAAKLHGIQPGSFLDEIEHRAVVPLAVKPLTLEFLLQSFQQNKGVLPESTVELYEQGCLILCRDDNLSRAAAEIKGKLTPQQRLSVAERIAGVTMFCKRVAIYTGNDDTQAIAEDITIALLASGSEEVNGAKLDFTNSAVRESVQTGLFTGRGQDRMGWYHWTFAEFLAARYAITRGLNMEQMADLVFRPGEDERHQVVPQLHETAAWMAALSPEFMELVLYNDPQVLLRSSVTGIDPDTRESLVDTLLQLFEAEKITDDMNLRTNYENLSHPKIAEQLRPYILDSNKNVVVRRAAIDICEACNTVELVEDLVSLALNPSELHQIRDQAANAIVKIGDTEARTHLKPLLYCDPNEDPDDQLKGHALRALWPDHLSAEELFANLTRPRQENFLGFYYLFVSQDLVKRLKTQDLPAALKWVSDQLPEHQLRLDFSSLVKQIMKLAWNNLDDPTGFDAFIRAVLRRIDNFDPIFGEGRSPEAPALLASNPEKRRRVLEAVLPHCNRTRPRRSEAALMFAGLVVHEDFHWLIEQLKNAASEDEGRQWVTLVRFMFDVRSLEHTEAILSEAPDTPVLEEEFKDFLQPVEIDSAEAERMRADYREQISWQRSEEEEAELHPPLDEIVRDWLNKFEAGDLAAWWRLNLDMTLSPFSNRYDAQEELNSDLTTLPGWTAIDEALRTRCIEAAANYLREADPGTDQWLGTNKVHRPAAAGYRALRLLLKEKPDALDGLLGNDWARWAPIILAFPESTSTGSEEPMLTLVRLAYEHAPEPIIRTVYALIDKENADHGTVFVTRKLSLCWDHRLVTALLQKVRQTEVLKPEAFGEILEEILTHDGDEAVAFALSLTTVREEDSSDQKKRIEAAVALLNRAPKIVWAKLWDEIQADQEYGRQVLTKLSTHHDQSRSTKIAHQLSENAIGDLYVWLAKEFPHSEDPKHEGAYTVGDRESIAEFRDGLLSHLRERGTVESVRAIRRIADALPELDWLKYAVVTAERNRLRRSWEGLPAQALFKLAASKQARLVESGEQLLEVIIESLKRLEERLQGETPAVADLWNDDKTPKGEEHLSDYVKRHLSDDLGTKHGVIANREVRIRSKERTDIHVDAIRQDPRTSEFDQITAIIETKGCWHDELQTAMETQLKNRYLEENQCRYGLYLVGWFLCPEWAKSNYRRNRTPDWTLGEARDFFQSQAKSISDERVDIRSFVLNCAYR